MTPGGRPARTDTVLCALLFVVVSVALLPYLQLHLPVFRSPTGGTYHYDEGTFLYNCSRLARGHVLYRDYFDFKGILAYAPVALAFVVFPTGVLVGRLVVHSFVAGTSVAMFATVRRLRGGRLLSVTCALSVPLLAWPAWPVAYQDFLTQFWVVLALHAALGGLAGRRRSWILAGVYSTIAAWSTLSAGVVAFVALGGAGVLVYVARGDLRGAWRITRAFGIGAFSVSAPLILYFAANGALGDMFRCVVVFPLRQYGSANQTTYAEDFHTYAALWETHGTLASLAVRAMSVAIAWIPGLALGSAVLAGVLAIERAALGAMGGLPRSPALERCVLALSLGSLALPPVLGKTRSDLCHLAFVLPSCVVALSSLLAPLPRTLAIWWRLFGATFQRLAFASLLVVVVLAGTFHLKNARGPYERRPLAAIDRAAAADFGADADRERLAPDDYEVVLPAGYFPSGFHYLLSHRDNATSFAFLENDGDYFAGQWEKAADEVLLHRPRLMKIPREDFDELAKRRPEVRKMYFDCAGQYVLDARRAGPPLRNDLTWDYSMTSPRGARLEAGSATIHFAGASARFELIEGGNSIGPLAGSVDEDRVTMLWADRTFTGKMSADGTRIDGHVYVYPGRNDALPTFSLVLR